MSKFCPLRSTPEKDIACAENCAFFAENRECAIKNLGNVNAQDFQATLVDVLDDIRRELENHYPQREQRISCNLSVVFFLPTCRFELLFYFVECSYYLPIAIHPF